MILDLETRVPHPPNSFRKAWCELTGGHNNQIFEARDCDGTRAVRLYCTRCSKLTKWYEFTRRARALKEGE